LPARIFVVASASVGGKNSRTYLFVGFPTVYESERRAHEGDAKQVTFVLSAAFFIWFLLIAAVQVPGFPLRKRRYLGVLGHFIPAWHFFAPKPPQGDVAVFYRSVRHMGNARQATEWRRLEGLGGRQSLQLLIYPNRRAKHVLLHCCTQITKSRKAPQSNLAKLMISAPYLLLLTHVTDRVNDPDSDVEFRIDFVRSDPEGSAGAELSKPRTIFRSPVHRRPEARVTIADK
jgi:hypothetical protein